MSLEWKTLILKFICHLLLGGLLNKHHLLLEIHHKVRLLTCGVSISMTPPSHKRAEIGIVNPLVPFNVFISVLYRHVKRMKHHWKQILSFLIFVWVTKVTRSYKA